MRSASSVSGGAGRLAHTCCIVTLACFAAGVMMFAIPPAGAAFKFVQKGSEVPDFSLKALDGQELNLASLKEGKAAIILFWATWSPRSIQEMGDLEALYQKHREQGLKVVAINVNHLTFSTEDRRAVDAALKETGATFPVALDVGLELYNTFGVVATPSTIVMTPSGVIDYEVSSYLSFTREELTEKTEILLGLREPPKETAVAEAAPVYKPSRKALLYFNLGRNLLKMGSRDKAVDKLREAVEADDKYVAPRVLLGHLLLEAKGSVEEAVKLFREAAAADPENVSALTGLGQGLLQAGEVDEAEEALVKAGGIDPSYTPAISGLGRVYSAKGMHDKARAKFAEALELNPLSPDVFYRRGESFEAQGMLKEAASDYRKAVEIMLGFSTTDGEV